MKNKSLYQPVNVFVMECFVVGVKRSESTATSVRRPGSSYYTSPVHGEVDVDVYRIDISRHSHITCYWPIDSRAPYCQINALIPSA